MAGVGRRRGSTLLKPDKELCWGENLVFIVGGGLEEHPAGIPTSDQQRHRPAPKLRP